MNSSSISGLNSIYQLVDQYMAMEEIPRNELVEKKDKLNSKKSIFSQLDSLMSAFKTKMSYLTDGVFDPFHAKIGNSSDTEKFTITADSGSSVGNHSIISTRLAKSDTRVSNQFDDAVSSFTGFGSDETFTIEVGHPTDADAANRVQISVTVEASVFSGTNDEVLEAVENAIDDAMAQAVTDETIDSDEVIHASVVTEETGKSRLVLRSEQTGYAYRMDFGSNSLLDTLNINAGIQSSGVTGGYITTVGTGPTDSELNSVFTMDGLTFYRDSNIVGDALDGVNIKFLDTFAEEQTITVSPDKTAVKKDVQEFIDKYNEIVTFLRSNTRTDPTTHESGVLSSDTTYRFVINDLRNIIASNVEGVSSDDYSLLYNIGIEANEDGTLYFSDSSKFDSALETNPSNVADLFRGENGVAVRIEEYVNNFVTPNGTIDASEKQLDRQVVYLDDRIKYMNEVLERKRDEYMNEFGELQMIMSNLQSQQDFFNSFFG